MAPDQRDHMKRSLPFWYEFASTYSWLAAERIEALAVQAGVEAWGLTDFSFFNLQDTQAFIAGNNDLLILAFRGTTDLDDWLTDAGVELVAGLGGRVHDPTRPGPGSGRHQDPAAAGPLTAR